MTNESLPTQETALDSGLNQLEKRCQNVIERISTLRRLLAQAKQNGVDVSFLDNSAVMTMHPSQASDFNTWHDNVKHMIELVERELVDQALTD